MGDFLLKLSLFCIRKYIKNQNKNVNLQHIYFFSMTLKTIKKSILILSYYFKYISFFLKYANIII